MLKQIFLRKGQQAAAASVVLDVQEQGLCYALSLANDEDHWQLAAYLDQLFEEDFASQLSDRWLLCLGTRSISYWMTRSTPVACSCSAYLPCRSCSHNWLAKAVGGGRL